MKTALMRATSSGERLSGVEVAVHNQDNREHDIFDSDDYLQFHGGMIATIRGTVGTHNRAITSATRTIPPGPWCAI